MQVPFFASVAVNVAQLLIRLTAVVNMGEREVKEVRLIGETKLDVYRWMDLYEPAEQEFQWCVSASYASSASSEVIVVDCFGSG